MSASDKSLEDLWTEAVEIAGRSVEIDVTADGSCVVLWMSFDRPPPPKGKGIREALENFIEHVRPFTAQVHAIETKLDEMDTARSTSP